MAAKSSSLNAKQFSQHPDRGGWLKLFPPVTLMIFLGPILAGFIGTLLPAFNYLPPLGGTELSLAPWQRLFEYPAVGEAIGRSLYTGLAATVISFLIVCLFTACCYGRPAFDRLRRLMGPLLSVPHTAVAIGFLFLFSPSGWIIRALSPWLTGWDRPGDLVMSPDPLGVSLIAALVIKEVPFLLLMMLGALNQIPAKRTLSISRALGYGPAEAFLKTVLPQIYTRMRLPLFAVLAFSVSVVDVALILTPTTSPTLGILILRWFNDPDLNYQFLAAAGACLQFGLVLACLAAWILMERLVSWYGLQRVRQGTRHNPLDWPKVWTGISFTLFAAGAASLLVMAIWSFAHRWRFPDALPGSWTLMNWDRFSNQLFHPALTTLTVGLCSALIALVLVLGCLETEKRHGLHPGSRALWLLYIPLLVPQAAFLFGTQILLVLAGGDGTFSALVWSHLLFVLPYVFLSLSESYRKLDDRYERTARCLGASPARVFWRVKLPMLLRPILVALAVGFAVSVGEYLPTIFAGSGRFATLTTETVSLASGGDRRLVGLFAFIQAAMPLIGFLLAIGIPNWIYRHRRGMKGGS